MSEDPTKDLTEDLPSPEPTLPDTLDGKLDWLIREMRQMRTDFNALNQKVDDRLHDTRPLWHQLNAQVDKLTADMQELKQANIQLTADVQELKQANIQLTANVERLLRKAEDQGREIIEIKQGLRRLERKMDLLNKTFFERQTDQYELLERVEKLETRLAS